MVQPTIDIWGTPICLPPPIFRFLPELNVFSIDHRCGIFLERYIFGKVVIQASQKLILQVQHVPQVANLQ